MVISFSAFGSAVEIDAIRAHHFTAYHYIGDVLKDCCIMLGEVEALSKPYQLLTTYLSAQPITASWQEIEAPLFSLRSLGAEVSDTESTVMPHIMGLLRNLPEHPKIRYAATLVIGRYAGWTRVHPEFIEPHLSYISGGFQHTDVSAAAALALKYLCQSCGEVGAAAQQDHYSVTIVPDPISLWSTTSARSIHSTSMP